MKKLCIFLFLILILPFLISPDESKPKEKQKAQSMDSSIKTETCESESTCQQSQTKESEKKAKSPESKEEKNKEEFKETKKKAKEAKKEKSKDSKKHKEKEKSKEPPKKKSNYDLIYDDLFLHQPRINLNTTNPSEIFSFLDFSINDKISNYINEVGMIPYPHERFYGKQQGNFLHIMHLAYEKRLPVYFSFDQILYPFIEITTELASDVMEKGLYSAFHQFLNGVINYGKENNFEQGILLYFSIALKFLDNETEVFHDDVCNKLITNLLNLDQNENITLYNFTLLGNVRSIDKLNFVQIYPLLKRSETLIKISNCLRFLQNFEFNIKKELYTIYRIGQLIQKSGQDKLYQEIKDFMHYIFNEEENVMNPFDIYLYISNNYKDKKTKEEINKDLYRKIKKGIERNFSLEIFGNISFINKEEETEYYNQRNNITSLFSYSYSIQDFITYKLLNVRRLRFYPSLFEFIDICHHGNLMRELIFDRYHGKNSTHYKLYKYRDGIDVEEEFNTTKKLVKESLIKEKDKWESTYENSFNYLLNIAGHLEPRLKNESNYKVKTFSTLIGSYVHFQKDFLLFEQRVNITYCNNTKNCEIPDLFFDNRTNFYQEIQKITIMFQNKLISLINVLEDKSIKTELGQLIENRLKRLYNSYEYIMKGIELQNNGIFNEERKKIKEKFFYYDKRTKQYQGWYVDLYRNKKGEANYALKIYVHNFYMAKPIPSVKFQGAVIYASMNYPEVGIIAVDDDGNKKRKMMLFTHYSGNEYPHGWTDEISFEGLKNLIFQRK